MLTQACHYYCIIMSVNKIFHLSLLNFLVYQNTAFALFHKIPSTRKLCHHKLFSFTTAKSYRTLSTEAEKEVFFQNLSKNVDSQHNSTDHLVQQETEGHHTVLVKDDYGVDTNDALSLQLSKLKAFATKGDFIIQKLRATAFAMIEGSEDEMCSVNDFECATSEENYRKALEVAQEVDLKLGLGTDESVQAWETVDKMYSKRESNNFSQKDNDTTKEDKKLEDILDACNKLEIAICDLQTKIDRNRKKREA